jgi:hypothetical protein
MPALVVVNERQIMFATEKSDAIATCKEMPVIPINKVVHTKRRIGKGG